LRIDIGGRRNANSARECSGQIGENIGVQIDSDDGIEAPRLQRHARGRRIDQNLVPGAAVPHHPMASVATVSAGSAGAGLQAA